VPDRRDGRRLLQRPSLLAVVLIVGSVAGCGSDDDDGAAAESPTTAETAATSATSATTATIATTVTEAGISALPADLVAEHYAVPPGSRPHDVAPAADGSVWYTAQSAGRLGRLDPATGAITEIALGSGSRPHGVIVGPDGAPWITDGGLNAIVRVDPVTEEVTTYALPASHPSTNLNTAAFAADGTLWFTGQAGVYGRLRRGASDVEVFEAPRGPGPYGITATPGDDVYYASLAGNHITRVDPMTGEAFVLDPPTPGQGSRRVWSDSSGRIWSSQWNAGQVAVYDPTSGQWREWRLPGDDPQAYAVYVDEHDRVWLSDFGANALVVFDPVTEAFRSIPLPGTPSDVRQLLGRTGEVWGAESAADALVVVRTR
jgi:virginiamycin B lyase